MNLLQTLLKADSEASHGVIRDTADIHIEEASLEEVRELLDYVPTIAEEGSCSRREATAFLVAFGGKQYPELQHEAYVALETLLQTNHGDVRRAVINAAAELRTAAAKDLVQQVKDCDPQEGLCKTAGHILSIWDDLDDIDAD